MMQIAAEIKNLLLTQKVGIYVLVSAECAHSNYPVYNISLYEVLAYMNGSLNTPSPPYQGGIRTNRFPEMKLSAGYKQEG